MRTGFTPELRAALRTGKIRLAAFAEFEFRTAVARFWSGLGTYEWRGAKWGGAGQLASLGTVEETNEVRAAGMTFTLSGVPLSTETGRSLVTYAERHASSGGTVRCWLALFSLTDGSIIREPRLIFSGLLDAPLITIDGPTFTISIPAESEDARLNGKPGLRYNDETQRALFPGDRGFEFVTRSLHKVDDFA